MTELTYELAGELDRFLGDPGERGGWFTHAGSIELDEREEFPAGICRRLDDWGLPAHYVPAEHGGRLTDYEQLLHLMRVVARRDLTVAIGHGKTYLGGVCVWVAGTPEQAARLGADIRAGVPVSRSKSSWSTPSPTRCNETWATSWSRSTPMPKE
ncbi:acyl-CoA dehydrogenase family protein [Streptomyces sp. NPDC002586]